MVQGERVLGGDARLTEDRGVPDVSFDNQHRVDPEARSREGRE